MDSRIGVAIDTFKLATGTDSFFRFLIVSSSLLGFPHSQMTQDIIFQQQQGHQTLLHHFYNCRSSPFTTPKPNLSWHQELNGEQETSLTISPSRKLIWMMSVLIFQRHWTQSDGRKLDYSDKGMRRVSSSQSFMEGVCR